MTLTTLLREAQVVHTLREHEFFEIELDDADASFLAEQFAARIRIERGLEDGSLALNPQSHVGVIHMPSGALLRCEPKLPVQHVFHMLAVAHRFRSPFRDEPVSYARIDDLFDFVAEHFANLVDARLARGLYRSYVEREENLLTVRGRILPAQDIRLNHILRHRTYCQYTEFTWDLPENRVIRQAVYVASHLVRKPKLRNRLDDIDRMLGEIDPAPLPLSIFDRFTYHRLNDDYEPIHRLCRLILEGSSVSEQFGDVGFRSFLLDMNLLFEQYVAESLLQRIGYPHSIRQQVSGRFDEASRVTIRPDLVLYEQRSPVLVADCKYKRQNDQIFRHGDLYQVLAYTLAFDVRRGALIYPRWEIDLSGEIAVRHSEVRIRHFDVDLAVEIGDLPAVMDELAAQLVDWADRDRQH